LPNFAQSASVRHWSAPWSTKTLQAPATPEHRPRAARANASEPVYGNARRLELLGEAALEADGVVVLEPGRKVAPARRQRDERLDPAVEVTGNEMKDA